jgi:hypothetical protein
MTSEDQYRLEDGGSACDATFRRPPLVSDPAAGQERVLWGESGEGPVQRERREIKAKISLRGHGRNLVNGPCALAHSKQRYRGRLAPATRAT